MKNFLNTFANTQPSDRHSKTKTHQWKCVARDGREVKVGTELVSGLLNQERWILVGCYGKPAPSTGRVIVHAKGHPSAVTEFYPSVFDLRVVTA